MSKIYFTFSVIFLTFNSFSQNPDTSSIKKHSPKKATLMSAIIPGTGQIYNGQYWKTPVVYAGMGALLYGFMFNQKYYNEYRNAYIYRHDSDLTTVDYDSLYLDEQLIEKKDYYKRYRDLSAIGIGLLYIINVIDATVYAHLYHFNVSQKLSMQFIPEIFMAKTGTGVLAMQTSLYVKMNF